MAANVEWVTGVIRAGKNFSEHGDAYDFSCTVNRRGGMAELIGGNGQVTPEIWREVKAALLAEGVTHAHWDRVNNAPRSIVASNRGQISIQPDHCHDQRPDGRPAEQPTTARLTKKVASTMNHWRRHIVAMGAACILIGLSSLSAPAQQPALGIGLSSQEVGGTETDVLPDDMIVNAAEYPWSAVGRLNTGGRGFCTGILVDEYHVLTDAHCLYHRTEGRWWQPLELHFVAGYQRDMNVTHSKVANYELAPGYRAHGGMSLASITNNWALVKLRKPLGREAGWLGLKNLDQKLIRRLKNGQGALIQAGYRRNAQHAITVSFDCRPDGFFTTENRIGNRCQLKPGRADLPFLVYMDGKFNLVANRVLSSIKRQQPRSGALSDAHFRAKLERGESRAPKTGTMASSVPMSTISDLLESLGHAGSAETLHQTQVHGAAIQSFESSEGLPVTGKASVSLLGKIIEAAY